MGALIMSSANGLRIAAFVHRSRVSSTLNEVLTFTFPPRYLSGYKRAIATCRRGHTPTNGAQRVCTQFNDLLKQNLMANKPKKRNEHPFLMTAEYRSDNSQQCNSATEPSATCSSLDSYSYLPCNHMQTQREEREMDVERGKTLKWDAALWHSLMGIQ